MRWHDLLFMHWPVPAQMLRPHIPDALQLDTFDGTAWLGVVPFLMDIRPRCTPWFPPLTRFLELNVRTYVTHAEGDGKPGVWFFSLDAASPPAVALARRCFGLPYFHARMSLQRDGDWISYCSTRMHRHAPAAAFAARYRPTGPVRHARPGTLEHFLTERYCLYAVASADPANASHHRLTRGEIHHLPWALQPAECEVTSHDMVGQIAGAALPSSAPLLHFSQSIDVLAWLSRPV
jgi:uncharacterized protein YqjF (DUF2071 family)